jgi:hypothetical protein
MIERWEKAVARIADSERQGYLVEEYYNDLAGRRILSEVLPLATEEQQRAVTERIAAADVLFQATTVVTDECIWGAAVATRHSYTPNTHWWYFRWPRVIGPTWCGFPEAGARDPRMSQANRLTTQRETRLAENPRAASCLALVCLVGRKPYR